MDGRLRRVSESGSAARIDRLAEVSGGTRGGQTKVGWSGGYATPGVTPDSRRRADTTLIAAPGKLGGWQFPW
jgi:hypothetical protein